MALPPSPIPAGPPPGAAPPPPAPSAAPADMAADDASDEGDAWSVCATIMENKNTGQYKLIPGDEPEEGEADMGEGMAPGGPGMAAGEEETAPEGKVFDTPQELVRGLLPLLNDTSGAESAFSGAGKPADKGMGAPPMGGM